MSSSAATGRPLRVVVIGSGPAGFNAIEYLQKHVPRVEVDLFDRLPTPYGLVRGGVAPDHPKIKSVTRVYDKLAKHPGFRFFGNVNIGEDLTHAELAPHYDAVIYSTGAQTDRHLGIPGEHLPGSHAATEFVGWYNAHPDYRDHRFDLGAENVAVIGLGNVAMDVTRMLATRPEDLATTDVAQHALDALRQSGVKNIYVLGRRGPVQAAFTNPELKELGELEDVDVSVDPGELKLDPLSAAELAATSDHGPARNMHTLADYAGRQPAGAPRRIGLRFFVSPVELVGDDRVRGIRLAKNRLVSDGKGGVKAEPTGETELLPVGLVFRSVGYKGVPVPGLPFDERAGIIPNEKGRALDADGRPIPGLYVSGWIKRGPTGVIGTNKPDAAETVGTLLEDAKAGRLPLRSQDREHLDALLASRGVRPVSWQDWQRLDHLEHERGKRRGAPREKFTRVEEILKALEETGSGKREAGNGKKVHRGTKAKGTAEAAPFRFPSKRLRRHISAGLPHWRVVLETHIWNATRGCNDIVSHDHSEGWLPIAGIPLPLRPRRRPSHRGVRRCVRAARTNDILLRAGHAGLVRHRRRHRRRSGQRLCALVHRAQRRSRL